MISVQEIMTHQMTVVSAANLNVQKVAVEHLHLK